MKYPHHNLPVILSLELNLHCNIRTTTKTQSIPDEEKDHNILAHA